MKNEQFVNRFNKGMVKDGHPSLQPNDSYRHAENIHAINFDGESFIVTSALGNELRSSLTRGFHVIGHAEVGGVSYLLSYNPDTNRTELGMFPSFEINNDLPQAGIADPVSKRRNIVYEYKPLYNFNNSGVRAPFRTGRLGYDHTPVKMIGRIDYDNSVILYMTDGKRPVYRVNTGVRVFEDYMQLNAIGYDETSLKDIATLVGFPDSLPVIDFLRHEDGRLPYGRYIYHIYYRTRDGLDTPVLASSSWVDVILDGTSDRSPRYENTKYENTGLYDSYTSNKSNVLQISNLDNQFDYVRVVVEYIRDNGERHYYEIDKDYPIQGSSVTIEHTYIENKIDASQDVINEVRSNIYTCVDMTEGFGRLLLANIKSDMDVDIDADLRAFAKTIQVEFVPQASEQVIFYNKGYTKGVDIHSLYDLIKDTFNISKETFTAGGYWSNSYNIYYDVGYFPGECYSFAIEFVLRGGIRTLAYNIGEFWVPDQFVRVLTAGQAEVYNYKVKFSVPVLPASLRDKVIAFRFLRSERNAYKEYVGVCVNMYGFVEGSDQFNEHLAYRLDSEGVLLNFPDKVGYTKLQNPSWGPVRKYDWDERVNDDKIKGIPFKYYPVPFGNFRMYGDQEESNNNHLYEQSIMGFFASKHLAFYSPDLLMDIRERNNERFYFHKIGYVNAYPFSFTTIIGGDRDAWVNAAVSPLDYFHAPPNSLASASPDPYSVMLALHYEGDNAPNPLDMGAAMLTKATDKGTRIVFYDGGDGSAWGAVYMREENPYVWSKYYSIPSLSGTPAVEPGFNTPTHYFTDVHENKYKCHFKNNYYDVYWSQGIAPANKAHGIFGRHFANAIGPFDGVSMFLGLDNSFTDGSDGYSRAEYNALQGLVGFLSRFSERPQASELYPVEEVRQYKYISQWHEPGLTPVFYTEGMGDCYQGVFRYKVYEQKGTSNMQYITMMLPMSFNPYAGYIDVVNNRVAATHLRPEKDRDKEVVTPLPDLGNGYDMKIGKSMYELIGASEPVSLFRNHASVLFNLFYPNVYDYYTSSSYPVRVMYSARQVQSSPVDNYRVFRAVDYQDYDYSMGEATAIRMWGDKLVLVQEHGVSVLPFDEKVLLEDGDIFIGGSSGLAPYQQVISRRYGSQFRDSVLVNETGVYGVDWDKRDIWCLRGDGFKLLGRHKIFSYLMDAARVGAERCDPLRPRRIFTAYDPRYRYVYFCFQMVRENDRKEQFTLAYSEELDAWVGFFSFIPAAVIPLREDLYSINYDIDQEGIWYHYSIREEAPDLQASIANFYGQQHDVVIRFIVNPDQFIQKVYDTLTIVSNKAYPVRTIYRITDDEGNVIETDLLYNDGVPQKLNTLTNRFKYRENIVYSSIPKTPTRRRQRDKWLDVEIHYRASWLELQHIITGYRKSMV